LTSPEGDCLGVGQYFEFVNRESALSWLWELAKGYISASAITKEQSNEAKLECVGRNNRLGKSEPSRLPGGFIVIVGASDGN